MWPGLDPQLWRELDNIRRMVALRHQTPTREWPLVFIAELDVVFVVREWPGGEITAYTMSRRPEESDDGGR
jgi:hypothetical protein